MAVLAGMAVLLGALAGYAYTRPAQHGVTVEDGYRQSGAFSYTAVARRGAAYPDGLVRTGQAVFPSLSPRVDVAFAYRMTSGEAVSVAGTGTMEPATPAPAGRPLGVPVMG